jgi:hypothetical protein
MEGTWKERAGLEKKKEKRGVTRFGRGHLFLE